LAELRRALILDSGPERAYDDITRLLSESLAVPITMVNLLDAQRDWFKSCVGIQQIQSPVPTSFCEAFFNSASDLVVVEDTLKDARFAGHPMVVGPRSYASTTGTEITSPVSGGTPNPTQLDSMVGSTRTHTWVRIRFPELT
jgi:GAF domain-containing protein